MGGKILCTMVQWPLPTAETIDLLVKMLPLWHICMYRVDNIPIQTHSVHLSLYYVMAISRQVIRVSSELTPMTLCESEKQRALRAAWLMCFCVVTRRFTSATLPTPQRAGKTCFLQMFLLSGIGFSPTLLQITCCIRLKNDWHEIELENCSFNELKLS